MVRALLHDLAFRALWRSGYEVRRLHADGWSPENLRKPGMDPATVIDVGVGTGTPGLHDAFPAAHHVYIEPLHEFSRELEEMTKLSSAEFHLVAAGATNCESVINVNKRLPMQSSLLMRPTVATQRLDERSVPVVRIDTLAERCGWPAPFGLKIDTEGYECQVVSGATGILQRTDFIIAELSVAGQFSGECSFAEFVGLMHDHDFRLCDILTSPRSREKELIQVDAMFRPTGTN